MTIYAPPSMFQAMEVQSVWDLLTSDEHTLKVVSKIMTRNYTTVDRKHNQ